MILDGRKLIEILPLRDLYTTYKNHGRLRVFVHKGRDCVLCDREGVLLLVTEEKRGFKHVDLYTDDFVLMNVDHIIPKATCKKTAWGRSTMELLTNKQTMCKHCNSKKGNKNLNNKQLIERLQPSYPKRTGPEVIRGLVNCEGIFNRKLEGVI